MSSTEPAAASDSISAPIMQPELAVHLASAAAASPAALTALGVTHVLIANPSVPAPRRGDAEPPFATLRVSLNDDIDEPLHEHLDSAADFIGTAVDGGRVCVICADGVSAAPAVVTFYLMRQHGTSLAEALDAIRAVHPRARPNVGFWQRLVEAESWLRVGPPSMSLQQYRWAYLEQSRPGVERGVLLQQLELGQAEVLAMVHRHSYEVVKR